MSIARPINKGRSMYKGNLHPAGKEIIMMITITTPTIIYIKPNPTVAGGIAAQPGTFEMSTTMTTR